MKYCANCGQRLSDKENICHSCGYDFSIRNKSIFYKNKIVVFIIIALIIIGSIFHNVYEYVSNPNKIVKKLEKNIKNDKPKNISNIFYCKNPKLKIDDESVKPLIKFLKQDKQRREDVLINLKIQANQLQRGINKQTSNNVMNIKQIKTKFKVFPVYKMEILPCFINIKCNKKGAEFFINDKKIATSDSKNFEKNIGPLVPGHYLVKAKYKNKNIDKSYYVNLVDNGYEDININIQ